MKKLTVLLIITLLSIGLAGKSSWAQTYEATIGQEISGSTLNVDLYLQTTSGTSENLGEATLVINYNSSALTWVGKDAAYDGRWDNGSSSSYNDLTSSNVAPRASLDVTKASGSGLDVPGTATRVGRITFTITNTLANSGIQWNTIFSSVYNWGGGDIKSSITFSNPGDFSLPVQFAGFKAVSNNEKGVVLTWQTESEVNSAGFYVWRSDEETGSYACITTSRIPSKGNSSSASEYTFNDRNIKDGETYWYKVEEKSIDGKSEFFGPVKVVAVYPLPTEFGVSQNYPNPFNPNTTFHYDLPEASDVTISVYSLMGRTIRTIVQKSQPAGRYSSSWDGMDGENKAVASGIYFIRMQAGSFDTVKKVTVLR